MIQRIAQGWCLSVVLIATGCPNSHDDVDAGVDIPALQARLRAASCDRAIRCEYATQTSTDPSQCLPNDAPIDLSSFTEGRVHFEADRVDDAIAALEGSCNHTALPVLYTPLVEEGGECERGQCREGLACLAAGSCPTTCQRLRPDGAACGSDQQCAGIGICLEGACRQPHGEGEPCDVAIYGIAFCAFDLTCRGDVCVQRTPAGEPCTDVFECAGETICVEGSCGPPREGDPCGLVAPSCPDDLVCSLTEGGPYGAVCTRFVAEGAACDSTMPCGESHRCVGGVCLLIVHPGDACSATRVCPKDFSCQAGACAPLASLGEACASDADCLNRQCSTEHVCARLPVGASCGGRSSCETFCDVFASTPTCAPPLGVGETCLYSEMCGDGLACLDDVDGEFRCSPMCG